MDFARPRPRKPRETVVPMINVVFLLLIFFLMTARLAPPDPVEVTLPEAAGMPAETRGESLYVDAEGVVYFAGAEGEGALAVLAAREDAGPLTLRVDAGLAAERLAALMPQLAGAGINRLDIAVVSR